MNEQLRMDIYEDVKAFFDAKYPHVVGTIPQWPRHDMQLTINEGINKAITALFEGVNSGDIPKATEGIVSTIAAVVGLSIALGIDLRPIWAAIHAARMGDGKPVDLKMLLDLQDPLDRPMKPARVD